MYENILVEREGPLAFIIINRPEVLNAMNRKTKEEVLAALEELARDDEVRVLIFRGVGGKAFVAGADVKEFVGVRPMDQREDRRRLRYYETIASYPKPVIAMIDGYCLGGGCELALACDLRLASEEAKLGQPEINLGIIPGGGGTQRLPRLVGEGKALQLILTGDIIPAAEAKAIGLVEEVYPTEELEVKTRELALRIAEKPPVAVRLALEAVRASSRMDVEAGLEYEATLFSLLFSTDDKEEGVKAFLEKRKPTFKGR